MAASIELLEKRFKEIVEERRRAAREKRLVHKAEVVARVFGKAFYKTHGYYHVFSSNGGDVTPHDVPERGLFIVYDDYGDNLDAYWNGRKVLDVHMGEIELYIPGPWEKELEELYNRATRIMEEREYEQRLKQLLEEAEKWGITRNELIAKIQG